MLKLHVHVNTMNWRKAWTTTLRQNWNFTLKQCDKWSHIEIATCHVWLWCQVSLSCLVYGSLNLKQPLGQRLCRYVRWGYLQLNNPWMQHNFIILFAKFQSQRTFFRHTKCIGILGNDLVTPLAMSATNSSPLSRNELQTIASRSCNLLQVKTSLHFNDYTSTQIPHECDHTNESLPGFSA